MTISSETRKAGPFDGNGVTTSFPFTFKTILKSDLKVIYTNISDVETVLVLDSDYTVLLNVDQNASPGGTVSYSTLITGEKLTILGNVEYTQETDIQNQGGFYPEVIENALDKLTMQVQQVNEKVDRSAKLPVSSTADADALVADLVRLADSATNIDTVAGSIANVNTVAGSIANVNTVAVNIADVTNFADVYQGPKTANPTVRNDSSPLQDGDIYFNTSSDQMRVYGGGIWSPVTSQAITITQNAFTGDGVSTDFVLSDSPVSENNVFVEVGGVIQSTDTYSVSGATLTISPAPSNGVAIEARIIATNNNLNSAAASDVTFNTSGTGAITRSVESKLREFLSVTDFGAVGDGVADDTLAIHAALNAAIDGDKSLYVPNGRYRVTSGYTNSRPISTLTIFGDERRDNAAIILDSASGTRFFYDFTGGTTHYLSVYGISFECAQSVIDTDFFRFTSASYNNVRFRDVIFQGVNRPIVFKSGSYSDTCEFIGVAFNDSGTIYSDSNVGSRGNLLTFIDVSHNGSIPENTAKQVMNLQGFRGIQATNLLLQGALPSAGWTVLYLDNEYSSDWNQENVIQVNGYWSEWTTNAALYIVDQKGGRSLWNNPVFNTQSVASGTQNQICLREKAQMQINNSSFGGNSSTSDTINNMFSFADINCHAVLNRCMMRYVSAKTSENFTFINCSYAADGSVSNEPVASALFGTQQSAVAFRWSGGYLPTDGGTLTVSGGTTGTPSIDATYGRKYVFTPNVNALSAIFYLKTRGVIGLGSQYNIIVLCKLPTFTGGTFTIQPIELASALSGGSSYDTTYSGQIVKLNINRRCATAVSDIGVRFNSSATGVSGALEVYAVAIYVGNDAPRMEFPVRPTNVITHNNAAPAAGEWARGDVVWNTAPSAAGTPGWVCTTAGTPGTWKAMASLAA